VIYPFLHVQKLTKRIRHKKNEQINKQLYALGSHICNQVELIKGNFVIPAERAFPKVALMLVFVLFESIRSFNMISHFCMLLSPKCICN
jgi:hypothetical protein